MCFVPIIIRKFIIIGIIRVDYKSIVAKKNILVKLMNVNTLLFLIAGGIATLVFVVDIYDKGFDLPPTPLTIIQ